MASPKLKVPLAFSYALNVKAIVGDFNQEEILVILVIRDCRTLIFTKVCFQLLSPDQ